MGHFENSASAIIANYIAGLLGTKTFEDGLNVLDEVGVMDTDGNPVTNEGFTGHHMGRPK